MLINVINLPTLWTNSFVFKKPRIYALNVVGVVTG